MIYTTAPATITQDRDEIVLRYTTVCGDHVERRFWVAPGGGAVREVTDRKPGALGDQVCTGLARMGGTLSVGDRADLINVIRQHWRRGQRAGR